MKVRELLATENSWCQGAFAITTQGNPTAQVNSPHACSFCLLGAIDKCYPIPKENMRIKDKLRSVIHGEPISWFNDNNTYATVKKLVDVLDI